MHWILRTILDKLTTLGSFWACVSIWQNTEYRTHRTHILRLEKKKRLGPKICFLHSSTHSTHLLYAVWMQNAYPAVYTYIYVYTALVLCGLWFYIGIPILRPSLSSSLHFQNLNKPTNVEGTSTISVFSSLCLYMLPTLPPFGVTTQCCCKRAYNLGVKELRKPIPSKLFQSSIFVQMRA